MGRALIKSDPKHLPVGIYKTGQTTSKPTVEHPQNRAANLNLFVSNINVESQLGCVGNSFKSLSTLIWMWNFLVYGLL